MKKYLKRLVEGFSKQGIVWCLVLSLLALGLSAYNTYILQSKSLNNLPTTQKFDKLTKAEIEKLIKNGAPMIGNPNAKVTVVEFADFQCPFCEKYQQTIYPTLKEKYIDTGKIRFIYMNYAFLGEESILAAEAAKCAGEQGQFWQYHDYLYKNQQGENRGAFEAANLKRFASDLGLQTSSFNECLDGHKFKKAVADEVALGNRLGVKGTPATFINDFFISGLQGLSYFVNRIDAVLK